MKRLTLVLALIGTSPAMAQATFHGDVAHRGVYRPADRTIPAA